MKPAMRRFERDDDYWRIRGFLREVFLLNERRELSWQTYRFDYWRWHGILNMKDGALETDVFIWEIPDGGMAAVLNREAPGSVFLQVHPEMRTQELEEEMIAVAEEHLSITPTERRPAIRIWAATDDAMRRDLLARLGYEIFDTPTSREYARWQDLTGDTPHVPFPEGYTIRTLAGDDELPGRARASWRAFHPDEPENGFGGWEWYLNVQRAPLYRRDLDIVAVAPAGEIATFATVWFDDVTRTGAFEPVGTVPEHQKRGLAKAVMCEGLKRLKHLGATRAFVGSYSAGAHATYASMGFRDYQLLEPWTRELTRT
ncbi:MAG: GNAT family N-acetyltransferase [bacterium]